MEEFNLTQEEGDAIFQEVSAGPIEDIANPLISAHGHLIYPWDFFTVYGGQVHPKLETIAKFWKYRLRRPAILCITEQSMEIVDAMLLKGEMGGIRERLKKTAKSAMGPVLQNNAKVHMLLLPNTVQTAINLEDIRSSLAALSRNPENEVKAYLILYTGMGNAWVQGVCDSFFSSNNMELTTDRVLQGEEEDDRSTTSGARGGYRTHMRGGFGAVVQKEKQQQRRSYSRSMFDGPAGWKVVDNKPRNFSKFAECYERRSPDGSRFWVCVKHGAHQQQREETISSETEIVGGGECVSQGATSSASTHLQGATSSASTHLQGATSSASTHLQGAGSNNIVVAANNLIPGPPYDAQAEESARLRWMVQRLQQRQPDLYAVLEAESTGPPPANHVSIDQNTNVSNLTYEGTAGASGHSAPSSGPNAPDAADEDPPTPSPDTAAGQAAASSVPNAPDAEDPPTPSPDTVAGQAASSSVPNASDAEDPPTPSTDTAAGQAAPSSVPNASDAEDPPTPSPDTAAGQAASSSVPNASDAEDPPTPPTGADEDPPTPPTGAGESLAPVPANEPDITEVSLLV